MRHPSFVLAAAVFVRVAPAAAGGASAQGGTSVAAPHAAGVAALYLQGNRSATLQEVRAGLFALTTKGIVADAPSANNHLLFSNP